MTKVHALIEKAAFFAALAMTAMAAVYGYLFQVWGDTAYFPARGEAVRFPPSKIGEVALFTFLALVLPLVSLGAGRLARST